MQRGADALVSTRAGGSQRAGAIEFATEGPRERRHGEANTSAHLEPLGDLRGRQRTRTGCTALPLWLGAFACPHRHFSHLLQIYDLEVVDPASPLSLKSIDHYHSLTCNE